MFENLVKLYRDIDTDSFSYPTLSFEMEEKIIKGSTDTSEGRYLVIGQLGQQTIKLDSLAGESLGELTLLDKFDLTVESSGRIFRIKERDTTGRKISVLLKPIHPGAEIGHFLLYRHRSLK